MVGAASRPAHERGEGAGLGLVVGVVFGELVLGLLVGAALDTVAVVLRL